LRAQTASMRLTLLVLVFLFASSVASAAPVLMISIDGLSKRQPIHALIA
jgi:hypothetical protein